MSDPLEPNRDAIYGTVRRKPIHSLPPSKNGKPHTPAASRFRFVSSSEFAAKDYRPRWLIRGVLVANEFGVIGGPSKALKTGIAIDASVAIASGGLFLDKYPADKGRVAMVSGESGARTLQETARRVCRARSLKLDDLGDSLSWCFTPPTFSDTKIMDEFFDAVAELRVDVVFIDPLYLSLGNVAAPNLIEMGTALKAVADRFQSMGTTTVLIHHANGRLPVSKPMQLADLAFTGLEQCARQWMLLNRRIAYRGDGVHDLLLNFGGSAGHGSMRHLTIEEGVIDESFAGRSWLTTVRSPDETRDRRDADDAERPTKRIAADKAKVLRAIDQDATKYFGATKTAIREMSGLDMARIAAALAELDRDGEVVEVEFEKPVGHGAMRKVSGFRRTPVSPVGTPVSPGHTGVPPGGGEHP